MIFQRGNPMDYDKWAAEPGMEHWAYENCLPYFKRMENRLVGGDEWRGEDRPAEGRDRSGEEPSVHGLARSRPQAGFHSTTDVNGYQQEGFAVFDKNVVRGRRLSAARAYLHPVLDRANLTLLTLAQANKIVFEGNRAGRRGSTAAVAARTPCRGTEIISCGGAFNSPQLLQLSGIGDPDHLKSLGIDVVSALPGVGENLQDHLEVYIQYACKEPVSMQPYNATGVCRLLALQWLFPARTSGDQPLRSWRVPTQQRRGRYPNLMFHFLPIAIRYDGSEATEGHGYQVHVGPMY